MEEPSVHGADDGRAVIDAVVLDADGVLIHPWRFRDLLEAEHGIGPDRTRSFFAGPFKECASGAACLRDVLPAWLETWGWPGTVDAFLDLWFEADGVVDERVLEQVRRLRRRGLPVFLASTQEAIRAAYLADTLKLREELDGLFFSCDVGAMKPDRRFFEHVEREIGLPGRSLLFFDDHAENVEAAADAGWRAELFTDHASFERQLARHLAGSG